MTGQSLLLFSISSHSPPPSASELVASTHGDHTVKVFLHHSQKLHHVFHGSYSSLTSPHPLCLFPLSLPLAMPTGHPRTPWTVKFHPTNSNYVASGCLGCEVRVWDIAQCCCRSLVRLEYSIISLAFQPSESASCGPYIAVASGPHLHMWEWQNPIYNIRHGTQNLGHRQRENSPFLAHSRNIRAVMFHPSGKIVFAAAPDPPRLSNVPSSPCRLYAIHANKEYISSIAETLHLSSFPAVIPQVNLSLCFSLCLC
jgi:WD40 repeat protein